MTVQIIDDERLMAFADFDNCAVWTLFTPEKEIDGRTIVTREVTDSFMPFSSKLPQLMGYITREYMEQIKAGDFDYRLITVDADRYFIKMPVIEPCKMTQIREVK